MRDSNEVLTCRRAQGVFGPMPQTAAGPCDHVCLTVCPRPDSGPPSVHSIGLRRSTEAQVLPASRPQGALR